LNLERISFIGESGMACGSDSQACERIQITVGWDELFKIITRFANDRLARVLSKTPPAYRPMMPFWTSAIMAHGSGGNPHGRSKVGKPRRQENL